MSAVTLLDDLLHDDLLLEDCLLNELLFDEHLFNELLLDDRLLDDLLLEDLLLDDLVLDLFRLLKRFILLLLLLLFARFSLLRVPFSKEILSGDSDHLHSLLEEFALKIINKCEMQNREFSTSYLSKSSGDFLLVST